MFSEILHQQWIVIKTLGIDVFFFNHGFQVSANNNHREHSSNLQNLLSLLRHIDMNILMSSQRRTSGLWRWTCVSEVRWKYFLKLRLRHGQYLGSCGRKLLSAGNTDTRSSYLSEILVMRVMLGNMTRMIKTLSAVHKNIQIEMSPSHHTHTQFPTQPK